MQRIIISTECVADVPKQLREELDIHYIYYDLQTEEGIFRDNAEVDAANLIEYMDNGRKKVQSLAIAAEKFQAYFEELLDLGDEVIHISISNGISESYRHSNEAREQMGEMGKRIHIIDSKHISSGIALLAIEAANLRKQGKTAEEIVNGVTRMIPEISSSFIAYSADYLYYNGKVNKTVKKLCSVLQLHPVLTVKNGYLKLQTVYWGDYTKASDRYTKKILRGKKRIDRTKGFITYAGCGHRKLERIKEQVNRLAGFEQTYVVQASATISCNCGPNTFGVLFRRRGKG